MWTGQFPICVVTFEVIRTMVTVFAVTMWLLFLYLLCDLFVLLFVSAKKFRSDAYPTKVPKYETRIDPITRKPVVTGLLHSLPEKSSLVDFRNHLQCATKEPNLNHNNGLVSRMRLAPFNRAQTKSTCAYVEHDCWADWSECNARIKSYENGEYSKNEPFNGLSGWSQAELLRVINGKLYNDWPWGMERFDNQFQNPLAPLLNMTLSRISDMRDSVFFTGGADPGIRYPWHQFPYLSECTHEQYADMIFPWLNMWMELTADYKKLLETNNNFTYEGLQAFTKGYRPWSERVPKAALFGAEMYHRLFMMEVARQRPDVMDSNNEYHECIKSWNPESDQDCFDAPRWWGEWPSKEELEEYEKLPPGYGLGMYNVTHKGFMAYTPGAYKYVVVPLGQQEVVSTSARIARLMLYSGAVVMLQRSSWKFHVQAQLIPWVHHVPISYSGADIAEKVEWLREHDNLARQIAENGRNFGRSYFRLEDFYCYAAHTMDTMAELALLSDDALKPFKPRITPYRNGNQMDHKLWYGWPGKDENINF